jgi:phage repressor protein C with HTH and peptisase S24 domain
MVDLSEKYEHYRRRMVEAMNARRLTNETVAAQIGGKTHSVTISKLRGGKIKLNDEWRAKVAPAIGLPEELLFGNDPLPVPRPFEIAQRKKRTKRIHAPANQNRMLDVYGLAAGSAMGAHRMTNDPIDEVPCPPALRDAIGAYVLVTRGRSMEPRYFANDRLYVNPNQPVRPGDHVIIQTRRHDSSGTETWVKRYDGEDGDAIRAWQYNPPAEIAFKKKYVVHVHRVLPINELL